MKLSVLMYHKISPVKDDQNKYVISKNEFERQMAYLKQKNYEIMIPEELGNGTLVGSRKVMITFDDGHETDFTVALPILQKNRFRNC